MLKNPIVCYLFTRYDKTSSLINFVNYYKENSAGIDHTLVICFKLLDKKKINSLKKYLKGLIYIEFDDPENINDFDFGSYRRIALKYVDNDILFLNSHSYPICSNWLKKLYYHFNKDTLIGTSASNESILDSIKLKKRYKFISFIFKKFYFKKKFKSFPNPHIRTSSFLVNAQKLTNYLDNKIIKYKKDAWEIESGFNSITNYFKKNNYGVFVVNSDGDKFSENNWKLSETFNFFKESKSIISDKHTRKYLLLNENEKRKFQLNSWGI